MRQCGFDVFEVPERHDLDIWQKAATAMTLFYQPGYGQPRGSAPPVIGYPRHGSSP